MQGDAELSVRTDDLTWREVEGEILVLDHRSAAYLSVNGSGVLLWKRMAGGARRGDLVAELVSAYGIEEERASGDVDAFVEMLRRHDLVAPARGG